MNGLLPADRPARATSTLGSRHETMTRTPSSSSRRRWVLRPDPTRARHNLYHPRLVIAILAVVAEMERELIADRVREGFRHAARQGKRIGRPPVTARPGLAARWSRAIRTLPRDGSRIVRQPAGSASGRPPLPGSWPPSLPLGGAPLAELPVYHPADAGICRLLAGGSLPTAAIADGLTMPDRTVRHRLFRLRRAGLIVTGPDGLHRLAAPDRTDLAAATTDLAAAGIGHAAAPLAHGPAATRRDGKETLGAYRRQATSSAGHWPALAVLGVAAIGLAAVVIRWRPPDPPPPPPVASGTWGPWTGW